jgi:hypothetical protein
MQTELFVLALQLGASQAANHPDGPDTPQIDAGQSAHQGGRGQPVQLNLDPLGDGNGLLTTELVETVTTPRRMRTVLAGQMKPRKRSAHHFPLGETPRANDLFSQARRERALKITIVNE